jgi:4-hydroxybenzoate polyprenyltransferase
LGLAVAPVGGWLAVRGSFAPTPWLLAAGVLTWVAGFDTVYACQDVEFDRAEGLHSIPARFGVGAALVTARVLHATSVAALVAVGWFAGLHPVYWIGMATIAAILFWQHRIVRADDLSRVGMAFFNMNAVVSIVYFATVLVAVVLAGGSG